VNPNIAARLAERAAQVPGRDAIVQVRGRRMDRVGFGELAERVARTAAGLREMGIGPDRRVLLFVPMSIDLYVAMLATLHAGATAVFVDAWADRRRLDAAVAAARPDLFLGRPRAHLLRLLGRAVRGIPKHRVVGSRWFALGRLERDAVAPAVAVPGSRPALITFTTGTTGKPKAAARSHDFLWAQHLALAEHLRLRDTDVDMPTLPVFVLNNLALGVTSVIPDFDPARPASIDPARILKQAVENGVTTTSGSPAFYDRLLGFVEPSGGRLPFRDLWTGGLPYTPRSPAASPLGAGRCPCRLRQHGGGADRGDHGRRAGRTHRVRLRARRALRGDPVPGIRLKVIRPHEGAVVLGESGWGEWEVPWGEAGEIVVAGDHVLGEYLDSPEETRLNKIRDGETAWHRTGDGGRLDADGRLWLLGRIGSRVRRGDTVWWSTPAELRASSLAPVRHAAYLGAPDRELGERAVLCVESGEARSSLEPALRSALGPIPVDEVRVLDRIPRDPRHASRTDTAALRRILGLAGP
jgi:olefin beta-lactone synthetase